MRVAGYTRVSTQEQAINGLLRSLIMDMEELFDIICQYFITKREYFEIFGHQNHLSAMEGWVRGEIVWLLHHLPLNGQDIFIATGTSKVKGETGGTGIKGPHPDLHLKFSDTSDTVYVELKTIVMVIDSNVWDGTLVRQLKTEYNRLLSGVSDWFISFTYPLSKDKIAHGPLPKKLYIRVLC